MLSEKTLAIAKTQIGVVEVPKGSNSGPHVNQYLKSVGLKPGFAWCMALVYWCVNQAAQELNVKNPLVKTGGVLRQWNETTLRKLPKTSRGIKPGDIFIMKFGKANGHTGFITKVEGGMIHTIEGNTNDEGSREGYEVCERVRPLSSLLGVIQL
jgi:hypothetical protein